MKKQISTCKECGEVCTGKLEVFRGKTWSAICSSCYHALEGGAATEIGHLEVPGHFLLRKLEVKKKWDKDCMDAQVPPIPANYR